MEDHEPEARIRGWMTLTKILVPTCRYCLNCTKFGQLILKKIIKIVATRCPILRLKCTKFDFGLGAPPQTPKLDLKGPTSKGREGREGKGGEGGGGIGREGKGRRGRGGGAIQCLASGRHRLSCATVRRCNLSDWCTQLSQIIRCLPIQALVYTVNPSM